MGSNLFSKIPLTILGVIGWCYSLSPLFFRKIFAVIVGGSLKLAGVRKKVVLDNLQQIFPASNASYSNFRNEVFSSVYLHIGHLIGELCMLFGGMGSFCKRNGVLLGKEFWEEAIKNGKGVIFLSSHVGNWELMACIATQRGLTTTLVTKHLKPQWLHEAVEKSRKKNRISGTYEPRTMRDILLALRKNQSVGIVLDQYAGPPLGIRVPFFGIPVGTAGAVAAIAKRTGASVLPVVCYRDSNGKVVVNIQKPLQWIAAHDAVSNESQELFLNTAYYASVVQTDIRNHLHQWLWTHRRLKGDLSPLVLQVTENSGRSRRSTTARSSNTIEL